MRARREARPARGRASRRSGEVAPLVDERAIDRTRAEIGAGGEIPAAARERNVGAEVEDVAVGRLALERDGAVGRGERARRPRGEARGRGRDVREGARLGREALVELDA